MTRPAIARAPGHSRARPAKTPDRAAPHRHLLAADAALGLGLNPAQIEALVDYAALLQRWSRVFNLTALRDEDQVLTLHLSDCLAALPSLRRYAAGRPLGVLDVGSGAGLPGVVLAIAQPDWRVDCVDAAAKKASFVRQVAAELGLRNLHAWHVRIEDLSVDPPETGPAAAPAAKDRPKALMPDRRRFDLIVARAFASLADFVTRSRPLLAEGGAWVAMKGQPSPAELAELPRDLDLFHVEPIQVPGLDAHRCLVWIRPGQGAPGA